MISEEILKKSIPYLRLNRNMCNRQLRLFCIVCCNRSSEYDRKRKVRLPLQERERLIQGYPIFISRNLSRYLLLLLQRLIVHQDMVEKRFVEEDMVVQIGSPRIERGL